MMYVMQVMTGSERDACREMRRKGYAAYAPEKEMYIRRGGKWGVEVRLFFTGYVFVTVDDLRAQDYYSLKSCTGFIRLLGAPMPTPVSTQEEKYILMMANDGTPLAPSKAYITLDGDIVVVSGPLKLFEAEITWFSRRQRKAQVETDIAGMRHRITFPVNFL